MWELKNGQARGVDNMSEEEVVIKTLVVSYYSKIGSLNYANRNLSLSFSLSSCMAVASRASPSAVVAGGVAGSKAASANTAGTPKSLGLIPPTSPCSRPFS